MIVSVPPELVRLPCNVRKPPIPTWVAIVPVLVSVPDETVSVSLSPQPSPLLSVIVPALVKLPPAVTAACSEQVLKRSSACPLATLPARLLRPSMAMRAAPVPV